LTKLRAVGLLLLACLLAPLVGSTPIRLARVFDRSIPFADNVDAQIFFVAPLSLSTVYISSLLLT